MGRPRDKKKFIKLGATVAAASLLVVSFQNCGGDMTPLTQAIEGQGLFDSQQALDNASLPGLLSADSLSYWTKDGVSSIAKSPTLADSNSVILAVDSAATGTVYTLNSGTNLDESRISLSGGKVRAWHITDGSNYAYLEAALPSGVSGKVLIAAAFDADAKKITLLVNGWNQTGTLMKTGSPLGYSYLLKTWSTAASVAEAVVYAEALSGADLNVMSRYVANRSNVANVGFDPSLVDSGGGDPVSVPTPQFLAAKSIIDAHCLECHTGSDYGSFKNLTQDQFVQRGFVSPGNPASSQLYYKLNGASASGTMPKGETALTAGQIQVIADWINSIQ
jgi:hypothetical protein